MVLRSGHRLEDQRTTSLSEFSGIQVRENLKNN